MTSRAPESMSIALPDGRKLDVTLHPDDPGESAEATLIEPIRRRVFDRCPICGDPAMSQQHIPLAPARRKFMTMTCLPPPSLPNGRRPWPAPGEASAVPEHPGGEFVLVFDGRANPDVTAMLDFGEVDLDALLPDWNRCSLALLKEAYLASCQPRSGAGDGHMSRC